MGDFAQLPPVLATSVLPGMPLVESGGPVARATALAGRQTFAMFEDVIRLRRIHRQKGVDAFKESTMRLRDAAITKEDYDLWKTHELGTLHGSGPGSASLCPWEGGRDLGPRGSGSRSGERSCRGKTMGRSWPPGRLSTARQALPVRQALWCGSRQDTATPAACTKVPMTSARFAVHCTCAWGRG